MLNLRSINSQNGSALLICLVLLTVLSLVGVSSMENTMLEEKMSANTQFKIQAFHSTQNEIDEQYTALGENSTPIVTSMDGDVAMTGISYNTGMSTVSGLSFIGEYERKARLQEQIQSLGSSKVLITELTVTSVSTNSGASSQQTLGTELASPSS